MLILTPSSGLPKTIEIEIYDWRFKKHTYNKLRLKITIRLTPKRAEFRKITLWMEGRNFEET
ncbi:MAG TPA: hypothetical protein VEQ18_02320 [Candidatus Nitrosocosmicus sp.]|nr:hypothetical protein [Candidatus Nitrosocosmicus sp.]